MSSNIRVKKVSETKTGKFKVALQMETKSGDWNDLKYASYDDPHPELKQKMEDLEKSVCKICEFPEKTAKRIAVTGVSFNYSKNDVMGAVIIAKKELNTSNAPLNINTPNLPAEDYSETGDNPTLPQDTLDTLLELQSECIKYVKGKRKQMSIFGDDTENQVKVDFDEETGEVEDPKDQDLPEQEVISRNYN